jgi:hypothetical protein
VKFFLDNCVSVAMARALRELAKAQSLEVVHLSDRFSRDITDVEWIGALEPKEWVIVSGDSRISRNRAEKAAWHESGLTAFFLDDGWASRKFWVQAAELVRWWPVIVETARTCTPGSGFLLKFKASDPRLIYSPTSR